MTQFNSNTFSPNAAEKFLYGIHLKRDMPFSASIVDFIIRKEREDGRRIVRVLMDEQDDPKAVIFNDNRVEDFNSLMRYACSKMPVEVPEWDRIPSEQEEVMA